MTESHLPIANMYPEEVLSTDQLFPGRVAINFADEKALTAILGIRARLARAIDAVREILGISPQRFYPP